jgi:hypothetical protein
VLGCLLLLLVVVLLLLLVVVGWGVPAATVEVAVHGLLLVVVLLVLLVVVSTLRMVVAPVEVWGGLLLAPGSTVGHPLLLLLAVEVDGALTGHSVAVVAPVVVS